MGTNVSASIMAKIDPQLGSYFEILGSVKIKSLSYKEANLKKEVSKIYKLDRCYDFLS